MLKRLLLERLLLVSLLVVSVVLMLGTEVHANCFRTASGRAVCDEWEFGSEICTLIVLSTGTTGERKSSTLDCTEDDCELTCTVSGTVESSKSTNTTESWKGKPCKPGDSDCGIQGFAFCDQSKDGKDFNAPEVAHRDDDDDKEGSQVVRQPLILTPNKTDLPLMAEGQITSENCKPRKTGGFICHTSLEVDPKGCDNCCKEGEFITFTAQAFFGQVQICQSKKHDKNCVTITERCSIDPNSIQFGKSGWYTCELVELIQFEDGMK